MRINYYAEFGVVGVPDDVLLTARTISANLRKRGYVLRTSGETEIDEAFEKEASDDKEVYISQAGVNGRNVSNGRTYLPSRNAYSVAKKFSSEWELLTLFQKAELAAFTNILLGNNTEHSADFVICYTHCRTETKCDINTDTSHKTKFIVDVASWYHIPIFNLAYEDAAGRLLAHITTET
jgi:hypothetical protein